MNDINNLLNTDETSAPMVSEPIPEYGYQVQPMSHIQMSFGLDVPKDEDIDTLQLRVIAFAEYLSSRHQQSIKDKALRKINKLMLLDNDWDGYGSPQIDALAGKHARDIVGALDNGILMMLRITPTETGSISLRITRGKQDSIGINCEKDRMHYFVETPSSTPEFHSDISYTKENITSLTRRINKW